MTFEEYELSVQPIVWRIKIQVVQLQMNEYNSPRLTDDERQIWKIKIWNTLIEINRIAQLCEPTLLLVPLLSTAGGVALSVDAATLFEKLTCQLVCVFTNAPTVIGLRTESVCF